jgi:hypothetical protein
MKTRSYSGVSRMRAKSVEIAAGMIGYADAEIEIHFHRA